MSAAPNTAGSALLQAWMPAQLAAVEDALQRWVPEDAPAGLGQAMRYGVLDGGKRLRPLLVLAAAQAAQSTPSAHASSTPKDAAHPTVAGLTSPSPAALRAACAVELIHAYSLVHDDMPCMDNDVLRRGKPTVHVRYGQAQAMLAGDAMQALAFELLTPQDGSMEAALQAQLVALLSRSAGHAGMAGGQAIDLASVGQTLSESQLQRMHELKTGALLRASVDMGAACSAAPAQARQALSRYGHAIGLAFQVVDDILDVTQATEVLGKTAGKDMDQSKPTYVSLMGLQRARDHAQTLHAQAIQALRDSGLPHTELLHALADLVVQRQH